MFLFRQGCVMWPCAIQTVRLAWLSPAWLGQDESCYCFRFDFTLAGPRKCGQLPSQTTKCRAAGWKEKLSRIRIYFHYIYTSTYFYVSYFTKQGSQQLSAYLYCPPPIQLEKPSPIEKKFSYLFYESNMKEISQDVCWLWLANTGPPWPCP